jgi:transketolase
LGFAAFEQLAASLGRRFLNAGVAEQNMVGAAAGMALVGYKPWVYSITPFVTYRCLEQIRNDVCLHKLPVRIVGNGGGYTYGIMGSTHHALEDFAVLKALPNMTLFFPTTNQQVARIVQQQHHISSPSYLRLGISGYAAEMTPLHENPKTHTQHFHAGNSLTVIGIGHATQIALHALEGGAFTSSDLDIFGLARFPFAWDEEEALLASIRRTKKVLIIDEHYEAGSIAETLSSELQRLLPFHFSCLLMTAKYYPDQRYGSSRFHLGQSGLSPEHLCAQINSLVERL